MRWPLVAIALLSALGLPGCLQEAYDQAVGEQGPSVPATALTRDPASPYATEPDEPSAAAPALLHQGLMLAWEADCPCPAVRFLAASGPGIWMDVRVTWDGTMTADLRPRLVDPAGRMHDDSQRGFDDRLLRVWAPDFGDYWLSVDGIGHATIAVRMGTLTSPSDGPLLPNLVEMVIEGPAVGPCDEVERTEQAAVKCMRFGNGVGNPGHGPMQIRLSLQEGAQALTVGGRFLQEVRRADGTIDEHEVGPASFHPTHGHWHYDGFALFELYRVDPATGLRGELASAHHKSGFCFLDWDKMTENVTEPADHERAETDCLVPGLGMAFGASPGVPAWTNGISRGWYDFYESQLTDQYVDIDGLPAGTYELVATADPLHTLDELDDDDNQSSLLLRIEGDAIDVLEERAHYRVQDEDDH
ncbi:MAG TPA: lysyl oxidase family protein [Candidatus Thermoplasmatota archaeon]|nr:lysyl oxidase family protein [Candidatus Thermoplasmatota archaeon]